ncbi:hypothetical protein Ahy_B09g098529 [Arachis hypogaea]|uniref:Aminotransferase-like plant mobile domain-containing protein n=1 Tax=Arachis hypogaea TaxID=3818 RepID=A0A444XRF8_ARAHY|nr:hypothetical protein Ahy_B09g098529 [Arachis hypogaea]
MVGMSLLDVAAIIGLPVNSPDCGPLWLLQLWLNAIFEKFMTKPGLGGTDKQHIEGFRLADYKPNFPDTQMDEDQFWAVFSLFHSCKDFDNEDLDFAPFLCQNRGPVWLDRLLFPHDTEENELANRNWANLLAVQVIPIGLPQHKKEKLKLWLQLSSESSDGNEQNIQKIFVAPPQSEDTADSDPGPQLPTTVAHSISSSVAPDQPIPQQQHDPEQSTSHDSIQFTRPTQPLLAVFPPPPHSTQLLDHPPAIWVNDAILNQLLSELLNSSIELPTSLLYSNLIQEFKKLLNESVASQFQIQETETEEAKVQSSIESCIAASRPVQVSHEEFDLRIAHAISIQDFYDKEETKLEAELA